MSARGEIFDVAVAGGGPAGTSAAIRLALGGARVLLAEQAKFPRPKLCGEFITPECVEHFARLGVAEEMFGAGAREVAETRFYAPSGRNVAVPSGWFGAGCVSALGLSRAEMDERLMRRARAAGVEVLEETQAAGLLTDRGRVTGVRLRVGGKTGGETFERRARVVIDATGRSRALARCLTHEERRRGAADRSAQETTRETTSETGGGLTPARKSRARLVAFKAHLEGARGYDSACEIYFYRGGYGGLSPVEGGRSNLCFIASARDVRERGGDPERVLREVVMSNRRASRTLEGASARASWLSVALESFGRSDLAPAPGLLAAGDAASFIDPFTGSGMLMALEGGELAAEVLARWLPRLREGDKHAHRTGALLSALAADYAARYEGRFGPRLRLCSWLRRAAFAPRAFVEAAVFALGASAYTRRALARATRGHAFFSPADR